MITPNKAIEADAWTAARFKPAVIFSLKRVGSHARLNRSVRCCERMLYPRTLPGNIYDWSFGAIP